MLCFTTISSLGLHCFTLCTGNGLSGSSLLPLIEAVAFTSQPLLCSGSSIKLSHYRSHLFFRQWLLDVASQSTHRRRCSGICEYCLRYLQQQELLS